MIGTRGINDGYVTDWVDARVYLQSLSHDGIEYQSVAQPERLRTDKHETVNEDCVFGDKKMVGYDRLVDD